jgi:hypothetical protein
MANPSRPLTRGMGRVIAIEHRKVWIELTSGARLWFSDAVWRGQTPPEIGALVSWRQRYDIIREARRVNA